MGCFLRCLEGFDMVGDNDLLEADFIEGGCWNLTKRHNVVCKGETTFNLCPLTLGPFDEFNLILDSTQR